MVGDVVLIVQASTATDRLTEAPVDALYTVPCPWRQAGVIATAAATAATRTLPAKPPMTFIIKYSPNSYIRKLYATSGTQGILQFRRDEVGHSRIALSRQRGLARSPCCKSITFRLRPRLFSEKEYVLRRGPLLPSTHMRAAETQCCLTILLMSRSFL